MKQTFAAFIGSLTFLLGAIAPTAHAAAPPNIVFLLADDLGYADVGFMGSKEMHSPNLDKLAHAGAILSAHYVQPVCSPTRAALMTGRYATHTGVYTIVRPHAKWGLPLQERTLATALKDAGYETAITGKWHLGEFERGYLPTMRGFDHQHGHYFGMIDYFTHIREGTHDWHHDDVELQEQGYSTHLIAREACRLIKERSKEKPLFLYVPFNGVHAPLQIPESYMQPFAALKENRRKLAGMLAAVDEAVGQIVGAIDAAGIRENTLFIFSSDNGGPNPKTLSDNGPLRAGKGTIYEGGVRGCAFATWPGHIPSGVTINEPMHAIDWFPTLVNLAGGKVDGKLPLDGRDVWPMLTKGGKSPHDAILSVQSPERAAVRMGDWKLVMNGSDAGGEGEEPAKGAKSKANSVTLYNLATDIGEKTDLSAKEPERVTAMRAKLDELLRGAVAPGQLAAGDDATPKGRKRK
jgi:arylsulfatase A-like enzyme